MRGRFSAGSRHMCRAKKRAPRGALRGYQAGLELTKGGTPFTPDCCLAGLVPGLARAVWVA